KVEEQQRERRSVPRHMRKLRLQPISQGAAVVDLSQRIPQGSFVELLLEALLEGVLQGELQEKARSDLDLVTVGECHRSGKPCAVDESTVGGPEIFHERGVALPEKTRVVARNALTGENHRGLRAASNGQLFVDA